MNEFKDRLKQAREAAGITQGSLGKTVHLSQVAISDLEKGKRKSTTKTAHIAAVLGVDALWLETGKGSMHRHGVSEPVSTYQVTSESETLLSLFSRLTLSQQADELERLRQIAEQNDQLLRELNARETGRNSKAPTEFPRKEGKLYSELTPPRETDIRANEESA